MASIAKRITAHGSSKWQVQVRRTGEQSITRTFKRKTDAQAFATQIEGKLDGGSSAVDLNKGKATVSEVIDWYLGRFDRNPAQAKQLEWWRNHMRRLPIQKVSTRVLGDALHELSQEKSSPATVNRYRAVMSHLLSKAVEGEYIAARPTFPQREAEPQGRVRYLLPDELKRLRKACEQWPELHSMVTLAASAGPRAGELLKLEWPDVHLDKSYALLRDTKNGETRRMPIVGTAAVDAIKAMQALRLTAPLDQRVFRGYRYRAYWCKALAAAEIENFTFHDLRHTAASHLAMNGASLLDIATVLGHKSLSMVQRYAHLCDDHIDGKVARMNESLFI